MGDFPNLPSQVFNIKLDRFANKNDGAECIWKLNSKVENSGHVLVFVKLTLVKASTLTY